VVMPARHLGCHRPLLVGQNFSRPNRRPVETVAEPGGCGMIASLIFCWLVIQS
jgi:hypothetical protein